MKPNTFGCGARHSPIAAASGLVLANLLLIESAHAQAVSTDPSRTDAGVAAPSAPATDKNSEQSGEPAAVAPESAAPEPQAAGATTPSPLPSKDSSAVAQGQQQAEDAAADSAASAEIAQVNAEATSAEGASNETSRINVYGFADFNFMAPLTKGSNVAVGHSTFAVGHFNLYLGSELGKGWRTLSEVRFLYLPDGNDPHYVISAGGAPTGTTFSTTGARQESVVYDPTQPSVQSPIHWGGIEIQRAWIEYTHSEYLTVRMGQFLTPYGIWNVDHGSPTVIGVHMPFAVAAGLFPSRQTGFELYGSLYYRDTQFGYHLTLSNGRGPVDTYMDLDNNKALGGRAFLKNDRVLGAVTLGASAYRGKYTNSGRNYVIDNAGNASIDQPILLQYEELSLGADLKWELGDLLVQGELLINEVAYKKGRPPTVTSRGPGQLQPDLRNWGTYGLAGYRLPWFGIMPYVALDHYSGTPFGFTASWCGVNFRPAARVVLKAQYSHWVYQRTAAFSLRPVDLLEAQIAWGF
jgi:hypothetical protein